jgi:hypothetical protein
MFKYDTHIIGLTLDLVSEQASKGQTAEEDSGTTYTRSVGRGHEANRSRACSKASGRQWSKQSLPNAARRQSPFNPKSHSKVIELHRKHSNSGTDQWVSVFIAPRSELCFSGAFHRCRCRCCRRGERSIGLSANCRYSYPWTQSLLQLANDEPQHFYVL